MDKFCIIVSLFIATLPFQISLKWSLYVCMYVCMYVDCWLETVRVIFECILQNMNHENCRLCFSIVYTTLSKEVLMIIGFYFYALLDHVRLAEKSVSAFSPAEFIIMSPAWNVNGTDWTEPNDNHLKTDWLRDVVEELTDWLTDWQ